MNIKVHLTIKSLLVIFIFSTLSCKDEEILTNESKFIDFVDSLNYFSINNVNYYHMKVKEKTFTSEFKKGFMIQETSWSNTVPYDPIYFFFSTNGNSGYFSISLKNDSVEYNGNNNFNRVPIKITYPSKPGQRTKFNFENVKMYRDYNRDSINYFLLSGQCVD